MGSERRKKFKLKISIYSRLHLTLLAMHAGEYRINGGLGFSISNPTGVLIFSDSLDFIIDDRRVFPLNFIEQARLLAILNAERKRYNFSNAVKIIIEGNMRQHSGFGSGTAITLACLEALHRLNGFNPLPEKLVAASGRGGASGIGIHSYFSGGFVFDLGRPAFDALHVPSHQASLFNPPLLLGQLPMPEWAIGICVPRNIPHKSQIEERAFFQRTCPVPSESVYETLYHALFGLYAAVRENDRGTFCKALRVVQECSWKKAERSEYGAALTDLELDLYNAGAEAVGMSSLGPSLFFLADDAAEIVEHMRQVRSDCDWLLTTANNTGRKIYDD